MEAGLIETINSCLADYSAIVGSLPPGTDAPMQEESSLINTGGPSGQASETTYTEQTILVLLSILSLGCKFSNLLITNMLNGNIIQILY